MFEKNIVEIVEDELLITKHRFYFDIAKSNFSQALKIQEEILSLVGVSLENKMIEFITWLMVKEVDIKKFTTTSIVFSALTAEAYINNYAIVKVSKNYFDNYLDKLDIVAKWLVIPKLVTGNSINPGLNAVGNLKKLVTLRNKLVHYKTTKKKLKDCIKTEGDSTSFENIFCIGLPDIDEGKFSINTICDLVKALKEVDNSISTEWLELPAINVPITSWSEENSKNNSGLYCSLDSKKRFSEL